MAIGATLSGIGSALSGVSSLARTFGFGGKKKVSPLGQAANQSTYIKTLSKKTGLHPLAILGASGYQYQPSQRVPSFDGMSGVGDALQDFGDLLDRRSSRKADRREAKYDLRLGRELTRARIGTERARQEALLAEATATTRRANARSALSSGSVRAPAPSNPVITLPSGRRIRTGNSSPADVVAREYDDWVSGPYGAWRAIDDWLANRRTKYVPARRRREAAHEARKAPYLRR